MRFDPSRNVALAPKTTLELGGKARYFAVVTGENEVLRALTWAAEHDVAVAVLGGGSNLIVADQGFEGLIVQLLIVGLDAKRTGRTVEMSVGAGEPWDHVVAEAVRRDLTGLECLSGIPGWTGATPIQNVGAYGQEVADTICGVRVLDRTTLQIHELPPEACGFAYRHSRFKLEPDRWLVLGVRFRLNHGAPPRLRYGELQRALSDHPTPSLVQVRDTVLALRRSKSMVLDPADPNRRSAGSFFTNPVVSPQAAQAVVDLALQRGWAVTAEEVPRYPTEDGRCKLAAGWLIERAGFSKGMRNGRIGLSSRHALALVHHGGGSTTELIAFAVTIRDRVFEVFGVELHPEPVMLGVQWPALSR